MLAFHNRRKVPILLPFFKTALLAIVLVFLGSIFLEATNGKAPGNHEKPSFSLQVYSKEILIGLEKVPEFQVIQAEAEKRGLRVWLFGGTAAAFAHYVRWDLMRKNGDSRFQADRFDYDYTNIFRSTQDLDIAIDGNAEDADQFQTWLSSHFEHFLGEKSKWEVRSLQEPRGNKYALLKDQNFINQHSDSHSTGLIEITKRLAQSKYDDRIKDIRDWDSTIPQFLKDAYLGDLHFYFGQKHAETSRARDGLNPPIFSVIRYLIKSFQYELKLDPPSEVIIQKIIDSFDAKKDLRNSEAQAWLEKNGKKLIQNAVNIEYAWNTLERLGLRKKLIQIENNLTEEDSLAWWLNREPLRTNTLGRKKGRSAAELKIDLLSHETKNYWTYESMTRAHTGEANVLISRNGAEGEAAVHGDGFYTAIGNEGARGTQFTVHFRLDPNAVEGVDFKLVGNEVRDGAYVIILNRAAIRVIPESFYFGFYEFFEAIANGLDFDHDNKAIMEKIKRRFNQKFNSSLIPKSELVKTKKLVEDQLRRNTSITDVIQDLWLSFSASIKFLDLFDFDDLNDLNENPDKRSHLYNVLVEYEHWAKSPIALDFLEFSETEYLETLASSTLIEILTHALLQLKPNENQNDFRRFWKIVDGLSEVIPVKYFIQNYLNDFLLFKEVFLKSELEHSQKLMKRLANNELLNRTNFVFHHLESWAIQMKPAEEMAFWKAYHFLEEKEGALTGFFNHLVANPKFLSRILIHDDSFSRKLLEPILKLGESDPSAEQRILRIIAENYSILSAKYSSLAKYLERKIDDLSRNPFNHHYLLSDLFPLLKISREQKYRVFEGLLSSGDAVVHSIAEYPWDLQNQDDIDFLRVKKNALDESPNTWEREWAWIEQRAKSYQKKEDRFSLENIPEPWLRKAYIKFRNRNTLGENIIPTLQKLSSLEPDRYLGLFGISNIFLNFSWVSTEDDLEGIRLELNVKNANPLLLKIEELFHRSITATSISSSDEILMDFVIENSLNSFNTEMNISLLWALKSKFMRERLLKRLKVSDSLTGEYVFSLLGINPHRVEHLYYRLIFPELRAWLISEIQKDPEWRTFLRKQVNDSIFIGYHSFEEFPWNLNNSEDQAVLIKLKADHDRLTDLTVELNNKISELSTIGIVFNTDYDSFNPSFDEPKEKSQELNQLARRHKIAQHIWPTLSKKLRAESPEIYDKIFGSPCESLLDILGFNREVKRSE